MKWYLSSGNFSSCFLCVLPSTFTFSAKGIWKWFIYILEKGLFFPPPSPFSLFLCCAAVMCSFQLELLLAVRESFCFQSTCLKMRKGKSEGTVRSDCEKGGSLDLLNEGVRAGNTLKLDVICARVVDGARWITLMVRFRFSNGGLRLDDTLMED